MRLRTLLVKALGLPVVLAGLMLQWWNVNSCGGVLGLSAFSAVLVAAGVGLAWYLPFKKPPVEA